MDIKVPDTIYDEEAYPNLFSIGFKTASSNDRWVFEISTRRNDVVALVNMIHWMISTGTRMVGFNNIGFDYPILHYIIHHPNFQMLTVDDIYQKAQRCLSNDKDTKYANQVWESEWLVPQVDLFKIHHFDNVNRSTSLKVLEFNMCSENLEDLPYPPGTWLTHEQMDHVINYMWNDIDETEQFYHHTRAAIEMREKLSVKYGMNFLNHNDTKIGKEYFIMRLEERMPGSCFEYQGRKKIKRQSPRASINLGEVIFPYVRFERPEFQAVLDWVKAQTIIKTKGVFKDIPEGNLSSLAEYANIWRPKRGNRPGKAKRLNTVVDGFEFDFGLGGIHGSVSSTTLLSDDEWMIIDADVEGYYPSLGIANRAYPEHLSDIFCDLAAEIKADRKNYAKNTPENATFKLANNGVYGDSNSTYSPFYDPKYTMTITLNGQLLLCMLAEQLMKIPELTLIQMNTDGLTVKMRRCYHARYMMICEWWQEMTGLVLEYANYNRMFVRDVNNYMAEDDKGKLKRKGAYGYITTLDDPNTREVTWEKNHSQLVVAKAAEAALIRGEDYAQFIRNHPAMKDFMCLAKVDKKCRLELDGVKIQSTSRYYVSTNGGELVIIRPPLAGKVDERKERVCVGWNVTECNDLRNMDHRVIDYDYYIEEARKLIEPLREGVA